MALKQDLPIIQIKNISKSFGIVKANDSINLDIYPKRIKALLGENGSGKSTLMSILSGRMIPDSGEIIINGKPANLRTPRDAFAQGIGMVYQHFTLVESMNVSENIILGQQKGFLFDRQLMKDTIAKLSDKYSLDLDPSERIRNLSMGEKQRVEIAKLLYRNSQVLIFDEPTAVLTPQETEQLFKAMRNMVSQGKSIVFISHKLQEVLDISDEISILRLGKVIDSFDRATIPDVSVLANKILGREKNEFTPAAPLPTGKVVLSVKNLNEHGLKDLSLEVKQGEIIAVAGVSGNGQKELVELLSGQLPLNNGEIKILEKSWQKYYLTTPSRQDLAYIPEDRLVRAVAPSANLIENFLLTTRKEFSRGIWLKRESATKALNKLISEYGIVPANAKALAKSFSGGNLQKFVIARELYRDPHIIIAENPTQGLDVAATEEVWKRLLEARSKAGILLITGDLSEALTLADRIAVMFQGRIMDTFSKKDLRKVENIGMLMAGISMP